MKINHLVYQPITEWLTKSLGKIDLRVCETDFTTLLHEGVKMQKSGELTTLCRVEN